MITHEQDPDVIRWGLQLFDGDPYSNCAYCGSFAQHNGDCYSGHYSKGYQYDEDCSYAGDHNLNLNNLHEELSQLSVTEPIKPFQEGMEHQTSFCSQDWFPQSLGNYSYVVDGMLISVKYVMPYPSSPSLFQLIFINLSLTCRK